MDTPQSPTLAQALTTGIELKITGTLPGEGLATACVNAWSTNRQTMSQAHRDRYDEVQIQQLEDLQSLWRRIFVEIGVLPK